MRTSKILFIVLINFLWVGKSNLFAQGLREYKISKSISPIKLDGFLDEDIWGKVEVANRFIQFIPSPGDSSLYNTEVKLIYSENSLFIGTTLYQPSKILLKQMTARDELGRCNADVFTVFLDTYNDHQNGFAFRVSAAGVQQDERISGGVEYGDLTWDAVWNSRVSLHADKWVVEMEIPYSAIRFSKAEDQIWGLNFSRLVRSKNETSYWSPIDIKRQGFLAQEGVLKGLQYLNPPIRLFLFPYLSGGYYHKPEGNNVVEGFSKSGGLDIKYGINESFTIDATLIPDFSQVVSDNLIRNLSPFEQQLSENRPFFTEGTELFNKAEIFYTRRVGAQPSKYSEVYEKYGDTNQFIIQKNPNVTTLFNALKFSGRTKKNIGIGIFNAIGAPMHAKVLDKADNSVKSFETEPFANYNVVVIDKPLRGQSFINFTNTNKLKAGVARDANVSSLQWLQFSKQEKHSLGITAKLSTLHDVKYRLGSSISSEFRKTAGKFRYGIGAGILTPKFDQSDMGLQFDLNESVQTLSLSYAENKPLLPFLQTYRISTDHTLRFNFSPFVFKEYQFAGSYFWLFKNFWDVTLELESKPFAPVNFYFLRNFNRPLQTNPYFWSALGGSSDSRKKLFWAYYIGYGFSNRKTTGYFYAEQSIRYLIQSKFEVSVKGTMTRDDGNIGYAFYDDNIQEPIVGKRFVREYEGQLSMKYNFSPNINFTARFRHYNSFLTYQSLHTVDKEGRWRSNAYPSISGLDENFNLQNIDVFFNWIFKPGSRLVVSYKQWLQDAYILNDKRNNYYNNVYEIIQSPKAYELAVRLIYFIDYNQIRNRHVKKYR